jgi:WD40 repeat protein
VWDVANERPAQERFNGHTGWVACVGFAPPVLPAVGLGAAAAHPRLVTGSWDQTVRSWDPTSGLPLGEPVVGHGSRVTGVAVGTDPKLGATLLACSYDEGKGVGLWDLESGVGRGRLPSWDKCRLTGGVAFGVLPPGGAGTPTRPTAGPTLLLAAACDDGTVRVWDVGAECWLWGPLEGHQAEVNCVAFGGVEGGPLLLASGSSDCSVRVWNPVFGAPYGAALVGHQGHVISVALEVCPWDPGRLLAASGSKDCSVRLWDVGSGQGLHPALNGHTAWVCGVAFGRLPSGGLLVASGAADCSVRLWDVATGGPLARVMGHTDVVRAVAFGVVPPWGALVGGGESGSPLAGSAGVACEGRPGPPSGAGEGRPACLLLATASRDETVRVYRVDGRTGMRTPSQPSALPPGAVGAAEPATDTDTASVPAVHEVDSGSLTCTLLWASRGARQALDARGIKGTPHGLEPLQRDLLTHYGGPS